MKVNTQFTVAVHTMLCIAYFCQENKVTSEFIADSTNVNPVIIRKTLKKLQNAGLVTTKAGVGGSELSRETQKITLLDIYKAVCEESDDERSVFNFHKNPNEKCPVGSKIHTILNAPLSSAQKAMESELSGTSLCSLLSQL